MRKETKEKLEAAGWTVGDTQELLGLSDEEMALIQMRYALAKAIRARRKAQKLSQERFAKRIGSSQSRVARMEAGHASVSLDLMVQSLVYTGSTAAEIGQVIAGQPA